MVRILLFLTLSIFLINCEKPAKTTIGVVDTTKVNPPGKITITDRTGKVWDVTHAVKVYGFSLGNFRFGLGVNAIPPILNPKFISPGEAGYPSTTETFEVIGLVFDREARAYPLHILSGHEVVDEQIGASYLAVTY